VGGWEIPARYFSYARSGDEGQLADVLEHNRLDLLSLAAVTAIVLHLLRDGLDGFRDRHDHAGLAKLCEYLGRDDEAEQWYEQAAAPAALVDSAVDRAVRADALYWLALRRRRTHRHDLAADTWQQLIDVPGLDADRRREALEALAIHHEHRAKDVATATQFALQAMRLAANTSRAADVEHRLDRLARKSTRGGEVQGDALWPER